MNRIVLSLPDQQKTWLARQAKKEHVSMAEVIREALLAYQERIQATKDQSYHKLLKKTKGAWGKGEGLAFQRKIRSEW